MSKLNFLQQNKEITDFTLYCHENVTKCHENVDNGRYIHTLYDSYTICPYCNKISPPLFQNEICIIYLRHAYIRITILWSLHHRAIISTESSGLKSLIYAPGCELFSVTGLCKYE